MTHGRVQLELEFSHSSPFLRRREHVVPIHGPLDVFNRPGNDSTKRRTKISKEEEVWIKLLLPSYDRLYRRRDRRARASERSLRLPLERVQTCSDTCNTGVQFNSTSKKRERSISFVFFIPRLYVIERITPILLRTIFLTYKIFIQVCVAHAPSFPPLELGTLGISSNFILPINF